MSQRNARCHSVTGTNWRRNRSASNPVGTSSTCSSGRALGRFRLPTARDCRRAERTRCGDCARRPSSEGYLLNIKESRLYQKLTAHDRAEAKAGLMRTSQAVHTSLRLKPSAFGFATADLIAGEQHALGALGDRAGTPTWPWSDNPTRVSAPSDRACRTPP
jgi:hypothetical protein